MTPTRLSLALACLAALLGTPACRLVAGCAAVAGAGSPTEDAPPSPVSDTLFTSTREVRSLAMGPDGVVWVATSGGVLRRSPDGKWRKLTQREGLPWNEVQGFAIGHSGEGEVTAVTRRGAAIWRGDRWETSNHEHPPGEAVVTWNGASWRATVAGLCRLDGKHWQVVGMPPSSGTHITALLERGALLWAAVFGDGLWAYDGTTWRRLQVGLPPAAQEITALAGSGPDVWAGTRRQGVWHYDGKTWEQHLEPDEPYDHNCQFLAAFSGRLMVSTLEDGLQVRSAAGWRHIARGVLSSDAPRQIVPLARPTGRLLYLRHGPGQVDTFDGTLWQRNVAAGLPRGKALCLAGDGSRLYVVQWGGWSESDGTQWTHHYNLPDLQGLPIPTLLPEAATLWLGTQSRGLAELHAATGQPGGYRVRWHDERLGLTDDWITALARVGDDLFAGTFVGGLMRWDGRQWSETPELKGQNVTALEPDGHGGLFIATRNGLWHRDPGARLDHINDRVPWLPTETQALCQAGSGLWIGTRTGIAFLTNEPLRQSPQP